MKSIHRFMGIVPPCVACCHMAGAVTYEFPASANILNVTQAPYNAVPDDGLDDTAAFKAAISDAIGPTDRYSKPRFVFIPAGTYNISEQLDSRVLSSTVWNRWRSSMILIGENRDTTILKLADDHIDFQDIAAPRAVIRTGSEKPKGDGSTGENNQGFRHSIINLTVDVGSGNGGAVGIDYNTHNRGVIEDVLIQVSGANPQGYTGLRMERQWPGPALVKNVEIRGFQYGLRISQYQYGMTFENLTLKDQTVRGIRNSQNVLAIRNLTSTNVNADVPVIDNASNNGMVTLVDAAISGNGATGISNAGKMFLRNVASTGFTKVVDNSSGSGVDVNDTAGVDVAEWTSHAVETVAGFPAPALQSLGLPVKETPVWHSTDFTNDWAIVTDYGATPNNSADDDLAAIQAAIDSGKPMIFFPNGSYSVSGPIMLRGGARKLMGCQSSLDKKSGFSGTVMIRHDGGTADNIILEHLWINGLVQHNSAKGLAIRHCDLKSGYENTASGTGDVFIEDVIGKPYKLKYPQHFYGRQVNGEFGTEPILANAGGTVWILGFKTEGSVTLIDNQSGAVELLGGFLYPFSSHDTPGFINYDGDMTVNYAVNYARYNVQVREIQGGVTQDLLRADVPTRGEGSLVPLYSARGKDTVNDAPTDIAISNGSVMENQPAGTAVGSFSTTDPDVVDSHTYTLVGGDTAAFQINGAELRTAAVFNFSVKNSYTVTVSSTDIGGLSTEKVFAISVIDIPELSVSLNQALVTGTSPVDFTAESTNGGWLTFNDTDNPNLPAVQVTKLNPTTPIAYFERKGTDFTFHFPVLPNGGWVNSGDENTVVRTFSDGDGPASATYDSLEGNSTEGAPTLNKYKSGAGATDEWYGYNIDVSGLPAGTIYTAKFYYTEINHKPNFRAVLLDSGGNLVASELGTASATSSEATRTGVFTATGTIVPGGATFRIEAEHVNEGGASHNFRLGGVTFSTNHTLPPAPDAPGSLIAAAVSDTRINLTWADNSANEESFEIEYKEGTGSFQPLSTEPANVTTFAADALTPNMTYTFRVRANNTAGDSAWSGEAEATSLTPYAAWSNGVSWGSVPVSQRDPDDNPDGDSYINFLERALGGDPTTSDAPAGYQIDIAPQPGGAHLMTLRYSKAAPELIYRVKWSVELSAWSSTGVSPEQLDEDTGLHFQTYTAPSSTDRSFVHMEVSEP